MSPDPHTARLADPCPQAYTARELLVGGRVQGVGFRPFVYRLARAGGLRGWVRNEVGQVRIHIQGRPAAVAAFAHQLVHTAPVIARPRLLASRPAALQECEDFTVEPSVAAADADIHVPPDYFTCPQCLRELNDPTDRRYRYPFINCTQCGPRYTLIRALPYDRPNTTMAGFPLCPACAAEYHDPLDRRFHAQPVACPDCGPRLSFRRGDAEAIDDTQQALNACVGALRSGAVVAIKGIGGYHLVCDAASEDAVS
ncbi:MAG TPA: acylphosphatase, partial [Gammaproteobacteria bacterium]|nr:acylphosphatase [Gammaproteobacteria bacterium]